MYEIHIKYIFVYRLIISLLQNVNLFIIKIYMLIVRYHFLTRIFSKQIHTTDDNEEIY